MSLVSVNTTAVSALTVPVKVAPLLLTKVSVLSDAPCPTLPTTLTTPVLPALSVSDWVLAALPVTVPPNVKSAPAVLRVRSPVSVSGVLMSPK